MEIWTDEGTLSHCSMLSASGDHAATNLPSLALISSPTFPDPLPTYSDSINLAHIIRWSLWLHILLACTRGRFPLSELVILEAACSGHAACIGVAGILSARLLHAAYLVTVFIQHSDMGNGSFSRLAPQHSHSHCACINVWGDVQPLDMRSWHLHARMLTQPEAEEAD